MTKIELLKNLETLEALERKADEAEATWTADPMSTEKENFFDLCYEKEYNQFEAVANGIVNFTISFSLFFFSDWVF